MSCGLHPQWLHDAGDCPFCTNLPPAVGASLPVQEEEDRAQAEWFRKPQHELDALKAKLLALKTEMEQLIDGWREKAEEQDPAGEYAFRYCADELEAQLRPSPHHRGGPVG